MVEFGRDYHQRWLSEGAERTLHADTDVGRIAHQRLPSSTRHCSPSRSRNPIAATGLTPSRPIGHDRRHDSPMTALGSTPPSRSFSSSDVALLGLLARLKAIGYRFITPTPATHARILARPDRRVGHNLRDALGWSLPFSPADIDPAVWDGLKTAGMLTAEGALWRSRVRVSSLGDDLFLHSAYPTVAEDSVFFGPDSYRFALLIEQELTRQALRGGARIVDIGTGTGVGGIIARRFCDDCRITMTDINPLALRFAALNATTAGLDAQMLSGGTLDGVEASIDLALANPPYIIDDAGRDYRDGGDLHGTAVALDMARMTVERLSPGGRMILYTGSAIIEGEDPLAAALANLAAEAGCTLRYREIDPDVFGDELARPAYADVERLAVVAAILERG